MADIAMAVESLLRLESLGAKIARNGAASVRAALSSCAPPPSCLCFGLKQTFAQSLAKLLGICGSPFDPLGKCVVLDVGHTADRI